MFFVFGPSGQMFQGGPENLAAIAPVRRVRRPQALRMRSTDRPDEDPPATPQKSPSGTPAPVVPLRGQDAVIAYAHTVQVGEPPRRPLTHVRDVMTRGALTVPLTADMDSAWEKLTEYHLGQAPVVNAQGHIVGMLLRSDMVAVAQNNLLNKNIKNIDIKNIDIKNIKNNKDIDNKDKGVGIGDVMVSPVPTVSPDTELRRVARVLLDTGLPGLPVTDAAGALAGFISRTDILRAVVADPPLDLWS